ALVEMKKLSKYNLSDGIRFKDMYGGYISGL
ncbi:MAG: magnesium chelatase subunit I, partial [Candidatus Paceibacteria bacterium]